MKTLPPPLYHPPSQIANFTLYLRTDAPELMRDMATRTKMGRELREPREHQGTHHIQWKIHLHLQPSAFSRLSIKTQYPELNSISNRLGCPQSPLFICASSWVTLRIRHVFELTQTCWGSFISPIDWVETNRTGWQSRPTDSFSCSLACSGCRWLVGQLARTLGNWVGGWNGEAGGSTYHCRQRPAT